MFAKEPQSLMLRYIDACVRRDAAASGLAGNICIGVKTAEKTEWWQGSFGRRTDCAWPERLPAQFDVGVAIDRETEMWLLGIVPSPGPVRVLSGDRRLWERFVARFLAKTDLLKLRTGMSP